MWLRLLVREYVAFAIMGILLCVMVIVILFSAELCRKEELERQLQLPEIPVNVAFSVKKQPIKLNL